MNRIGRFLRNIFLGMTSSEFYITLIKTPFSFSLKYFFLLVLIVSLVYTVYFEFRFLPDFSREINNGLVKIGALYPADLKLKMENGKLTSNYDSPFVVALKSITGEISTPDNGMPISANLLVIDTKTPFSEKQYKDFNTFIWLTETSMIYPDERSSAGGIRIMPFSDFKDKFTMDKATMDKIINTAIPAANNLTRIMAVAFFPLIYLLLLLYKLSSLLWMAIVVFVLSRIAKYDFSFSKSYQLLLHATTLPLIIQTFTTLFAINIFIPFWYTLLALIILFYFVRKTPTVK